MRISGLPGIIPGASKGDAAVRAPERVVLRKTKAPRAVSKMKTTAINIPGDTWTMLRAVAFARAQETGGRPSVSALITELAELHRAELEKEAGV